MTSIWFPSIPTTYTLFSGYSDLFLTMEWLSDLRWSMTTATTTWSLPFLQVRMQNPTYPFHHITTAWEKLLLFYFKVKRWTSHSSSSSMLTVVLSITSLYLFFIFSRLCFTGIASKSFHIIISRVCETSHGGDSTYPAIWILIFTTSILRQYLYPNPNESCIWRFSSHLVILILIASMGYLEDWNWAF